MARKCSAWMTRHSRTQARWAFGPSRTASSLSTILRSSDAELIGIERSMEEGSMKNLLGLFVVLLAAVATAISAAGGYHLLETVPVGGEGVVGALCTMDSAGRRLYVTHNTQVEVLDVDSGTLVGKIEKTPGVRAIAIVPELGRGFFNRAQAATTTIFDLKTLATIGEVKVTGGAPTQI